MTTPHSAAYEAWISRARGVPIEAEIKKRNIKLKRAGAERIGPCPRCGGVDRFAINVAKQLFNCRGCSARGDVIDLVMFLDACDFVGAGTTLAGEPPATTGSNGKNARATAPNKIVAARFDYTDEAGNLLFQVERVEWQNSDGSFVVTTDGKRKKTFRQRRPDPQHPGEWLWNVEGVAVVPYRLPELIEAIGSGYLVVIVEGEAKVDLLRSWNAPATCCAGGAHKWRKQHAEFFRDADVVILPDNDVPGDEHADIVAASLQDVAASVRIIELPGLPPKGDIIDWAKAGGTVEQLIDLIENRPKKGEKKGSLRTLKRRENVSPTEAPDELATKQADTSPPAMSPDEYGYGEQTSRANTEQEQATTSPPMTAEEWANRNLPKEDSLIGHWMSTTSRILLSADTGLGKTNLGMALAGHLGAGVDFLHWHIPRPRRVLFIDGEMSAPLFKDRIADVVRRLGCLPQEARFLSHEDVKNWQPLNTEAGQRYIHEMVSQTAAEAVIFDNVMALILGNMRDEEAWRDALPLVMQLTTRRIGQLWLHHTGHDGSHSYGTKTREWRMDTVAHGTPVKRADTDVSFQLEFRKARGRRPETRPDFQTVDIALVDDQWIGNREAAKVARGEIAPTALKFFNALQNVFAGGQTTKFQNWAAVTEEQWLAELRLQRLIDPSKPDSERSLFSKYRRMLITANYIACNNNLVWII